MDANSNNWRQLLPATSRQRIVERIMDTLQRHISPTGPESMGELLKIAGRFEETIFNAATDQQDYLRKMSLKLLSLETMGGPVPLDRTAALLMQNESQNLRNDGVQLPEAVSGQAQETQLLAQSLQNNLNLQSFRDLRTASVGSSGHSGTVGLDHREIVSDHRGVVWLKMQALKDKHLQDMKELFSLLSASSTKPMPQEQLQKLRLYQEVIQRMIPYMTVPKEKLPLDFNEDKMEKFEQQMISIIATFTRRRASLPKQLPYDQVPQPPQQQAPQQQNGVSAAQPHARGSLQVSSMNPSQQNVAFSMQPSEQSVVISIQPSQQSVVISVQPGAMSSTQQNGIGNQQPQSNVNPLQKGVTSTLQPHHIILLQPSSTAAQQPSVAKNLQQQSRTNWIRSMLPGYPQTILMFLWLLIIQIYFTKPTSQG